MSREARVVAACAGVSCAALAVIGALDHPERRVPVFLAAYAAAAAAWWIASHAARSLEPTRRALAGVVAVAVAARLVVLFAEPSLSTDVYRYVWEGRMVLHGVNPFVHPPSDPELAAFRDAWSARINHPDLVTIYPPLAQGVFALAAWIHDAPVTHKALFTLFDLGLVALLAAYVRRGHAGLDAVVRWAWCPLVVVETARAGHVDTVGAALLAAAVLALRHGRPAAGATGVAMSVLAKLAGGVMVPWMALRRRVAPWLVLVAVLVVAGYLPFADAGAGLVTSLVRYGRAWEFNGPAYRLAVAAGLGPQAARAVLAAVAIALVAWLARREDDPARFARGALGAVLLLSPTVYPWYVVWIVPFVALAPSRAWMALVACVPLSYVVWMRAAAGGPWRMPPAVLALEYAPFVALGAWETWRARRARSGEAAA